MRAWSRVRAGSVGLVSAVVVASLLGGSSADGARSPAREVPLVVSGPMMDAVRAAAGDALLRIGTAGAVRGYANPSVSIRRAGALRVANGDSMTHSVTAVGRGPDGKPLFDTVVGPRKTATVRGTGGLAPGRYPFYCRFHPLMRGVLTVTGAGGGGAHASRTRFEQPLKTPRVITSAHPRLEVRKQRVRVLPHGPKTLMWTYGGSYPAPTIRRPAGAHTRVTFRDRLPSSAGPLSVHLHGDHHAASEDGQPTTELFGTGASRTYDYPLTDGGRPTRSTLDFYHDHRMMVTSRNIWNGLEGMFEITSPAQRRLDLPSGRYDVPLLMADRSFDSHNQLTDPFAHQAPPPDDGVVGQQVLVDGRFAPYLDVATHRYRLRLLNGAAFSSLDLELSDGRAFEQIGNGDGLFAHPVRRRHILLGPAQTADVVVDFRGELGRRVVLRSVARVANPHHGTGTLEAPLMQFRVATPTADRSRLPRRLQRTPRLHAPAEPSFHWVLGRSGDGAASQWTINAMPFDPARVDVTVPQDSVQTWEISNPTSMTHYVHLHEEQWHTLLRDGRRPPPWERGLEDTWRLDPDESIVVAARFTDYPGVFMVHCHMLDHEDHGMMAQFAVLAPGQTDPPPGFHLPGPAAAAPPASTDPMDTTGPADQVGSSDSDVMGSMG